MGARAWATAATVLIAGVSAAGAQDSGSATLTTVRQYRYRLEDPAYRALRALKTRAEALQDAAPDADTPEEAAAWQALYDASLKATVGPEHLPHPWAGTALVSLAEIDATAGNAVAAAAKAQAAIAFLRPFRDQQPVGYISAVSMAGYGLAGLGKPGEAVGPLGEGADWFDGYFRTLSPDKRDKPTLMSKSNIEFAYGQALSLIGQKDKALAYQRRSYQTRLEGLGPNDPDTLASRYWVALLLYKAGQPAAAEVEARATVDAVVDHVPQAHTTYPRALETLGIILARTGRRSESVAYFQRSIEVKRRTGTGGNANFFAGLSNLADSLIQLERYDDARAVAVEAAAGFRKLEGERSVRAANAQVWAGLAAAADGDSAAAVEQLGGALTLARTLDPRERVVGPKVQAVLIVAELDTSRLEAARTHAAAYVAEARGDGTSRFDIANAELLDAYARATAEAPAAARRVLAAVREDRALAESGELPQDQRAALDLVLRTAVRADDAALGLDAAALLAGSKVAQASRLVADRLSNADARLAARVREEQDAARALKATDGALLKLLASGGDPAAARRDRDAAAATLATLQSALTRDFPQWAAVSGAATPDLAQLQASLARNEAVVAIVPAFDRVYTLTITRNAAAVRQTPLGRRAVFDLVTRLRTSLPTDRFDAAAAYTLSEQLFPVRDAGLLRGITSVRLVPVGPVAQIPFAALLTRPTVRPGAAAPWLIRRFALEVAPSFAPPITVAAATRAPQFLGIGAATPFGTAATTRVAVARSYFRGGAVDAGALAELPPLPQSALELAAAARAFGGGGELLQGDDASEARLKAMDLTRFTTLLFATHGLVSGEMEGVAEPALVLAKPKTGEAGDGVLTASEVATLRLDADWVILSACNTAAGERAAAPAYSGLAQAFRYAGARALLLSHWPVRDDAATFVTVETVTGARAGLSRPAALQRAMLKLLASRTVPEAANPYIWAPYILLD